MRKLYTKTGDEGYTKNFSGEKIPKDDPMVVVNGKIDLLQSAIDSALLQEDKKNNVMLEKVQKKMWQTAGEVAKAPEKFIPDKITQKDLEELEEFTDSLGEPPTKFIRFNTKEAIILNECRLRCRELEIQLTPFLRDNKLRVIVFKYVNRLSSMFYMMAYKKLY